ncbi:MAG: winged helix-turn-helix domain-containing protein [Burkholderiales bacterium]|jgi:DNA-binding response OmpR family regulator|nr:winged helix-turn-helix domain-containing protein [Betaproteobacteria bacterium]
MSAKHVFVVDDDDVTAAILSGHLVKEGYRVTRLADGNTLIDDVQREQPDAIILDGRLPSADGFDLCRELRPKFAGPILLLTARDDDIDELLGLELGADDYLRKPATSRIVLAHLRACLRRAGGGGPQDGKASLAFGDLHINPASRSATLKGEAIPLTTAEFDLLWMLASQSGTVLSREEIFRQTRGIDYDGLDRSIDMRVSRLRKLIGEDTENPAIIKTVRGKGYLFVAPA